MSDLTDTVDPDASPAADAPEGLPPNEALSAPDEDGPVNESDALRSLSPNRSEAEERAEAEQAASIADLIAERLREQTTGLRIHNLTLFNDAVSFGGGFAAGGVRDGPGGPAAGGLVPISEHTQQGFVESFVPPPHYPEVLDSLGTHHLVVLAAPRGSGREATAVNLLVEALVLNASDGSSGGCHRVTDQTAVLGQGWTPPHKNAGYLLLVDGGRQEAAQHLDLNWLTAAASALEAADSFMVVITGIAQGSLARAAGESPYVCTDIGEVDLMTIVEQHVLGQAPESAAVTELRRSLTTSMASHVLREQPRPEVAVRIAGVLRAGGDLSTEVARLRDPGEQVHQWFQRSAGDPLDVSFAVAAAVHDGAGYLTVADAALKLHESVTKTKADGESIRFAERLVHEQAWLAVAPPAGDSGGPPQVQFRSPLVPQAVLTHAWTRLDGYRAPMVEWLRLSLWRDPDPEVRARAAVAAGILAWADPQYALHRFLRTWASSKSVPIRQGAATAMSVVAQRTEHTAWVWSLLEDWVTGSTAADRRLAKTAATAVRGLLGRQEPVRALAVLRAALDWRDDWGNLAPVAWSAVHLVDRGGEREVLDAFLAWSAPQDLSPMVAKTLSAFLFTTLQPCAGEDGAGPLRDRMPRLLTHAREVMPELEELWARSLARQPVLDRALDALRTLIDRYADRDRAAFESLRLLVTGIASRPGKHRQRMEYWLGRWAAEPGRASPAAARLLHAVRELP